MNIGAVVVVLLVAIYMMIVLLWLEPPNLDKVAPTAPSLSVERIEKLGIWIKERQAERGQIIELREGIFP